MISCRSLADCKTKSPAVFVAITLTGPTTFKITAAFQYHYPHLPQVKPSLVDGRCREGGTSLDFCDVTLGISQPFFWIFSTAWTGLQNCMYSSQLMLSLGRSHTHIFGLGRLVLRSRNLGNGVPRTLEVDQVASSQSPFLLHPLSSIRSPLERTPARTSVIHRQILLQEIKTSALISHAGPDQQLHCSAECHPVFTLFQVPPPLEGPDTASWKLFINTL